jgi:hypothetical protein
MATQPTLDGILAETGLIICSYLFRFFPLKNLRIGCHAGKRHIDHLEASTKSATAIAYVKHLLRHEALPLLAQSATFVMYTSATANNFLTRVAYLFPSQSPIRISPVFIYVDPWQGPGPVFCWWAPGANFKYVSNT